MLDIEVKQCLHDSIAGVVYSKGVSLIHLAMIAGWCYVDHPHHGLTYTDYGTTREIFSENDESTCDTFASEVQVCLYLLLAMHIFCFIFTFMFEICKAPVLVAGFAVHVSQISCVLFNLISNIYALTLIERYLGHYAEGKLVCYFKESHEKFLGMSIAWLIIEFLVFFIFTMTMVICLLKSLCNYNIGADDSKMFKPRFLAFLANKLCETLVERCEEEPENFPYGIYSERQIANRVLILTPYARLHVRIKLNTTYYYRLLETINEPDFDGVYVRESRVNRWIHRTLEGSITKEKLDKMRQYEVNSSDMMMNTSILYHPESIAEMQFIITCLVGHFCIANYTTPDHLSQYSEQIERIWNSCLIIFICQLITHLGDFFIELFRTWEIDQRGKLDMNGVPRAKWETNLAGL